MLMKTRYAIGRHINGIFLNPLEYVLDSKGGLMQFDSEFDCKQFLLQNGATEDELQYFVFEPASHDSYIRGHWPCDTPEDCTSLISGLDCLEANRPNPCQSCQTFNKLTNQYQKENPNEIQRQ